tara:strand:+ start:1058 stop:2095 length:1038 start_codon:yes stop_codon:yes gene_type:complete
MKAALITGITGQDGSYLSELLKTKNYSIHGLIRRNSNYQGTNRINKLLKLKSINLHYGDLNDFGNIAKIIKEIRPNEIYNLGAQSDVKVSFSCPEYTADANSLGTLRILEAIRLLGLQKHTRFYQASTSELYGKVKMIPQREDTDFYPRSPYGVSKLYAHWITKNYREAYNIFASSGILFNHESPRRGEGFVTRKITKTLAEIKNGTRKEPLELGNLEAKRDWGHAKDYVNAMWLMLQHNKADDYVISSGEQHSVREFVDIASKYLGLDISWEGKGLNEVARCKKTREIIVKINPNFFRPSEVESLVGDSSKAIKELGWQRKYSFKDLVKEMCDHDLLESNKKIN